MRRNTKIKRKSKLSYRQVANAYCSTQNTSGQDMPSFTVSDKIQSIVADEFKQIKINLYL